MAPYCSASARRTRSRSRQRVVEAAYRLATGRAWRTRVVEEEERASFFTARHGALPPPSTTARSPCTQRPRQRDRGERAAARRAAATRHRRRLHRCSRPRPTRQSIGQALVELTKRNCRSAPSGNERRLDGSRCSSGNARAARRSAPTSSRFSWTGECRWGQVPPLHIVDASAAGGADVAVAVAEVARSATPPPCACGRAVAVAEHSAT